MPVGAPGFDAAARALACKLLASRIAREHRASGSRNVSGDTPRPNLLVLDRLSEAIRGVLTVRRPTQHDPIENIATASSPTRAPDHDARGARRAAGALHAAEQC